jgi:hypothetical protein
VKSASYEVEAGATRPGRTLAGMCGLGRRIMLALRLAKLIETHADRLSADLIHRLGKDPRCTDLRKVPEPELINRSYEIYHHLSDWILYKSDKELERRYADLGLRRAEQGVAFSHVLYAILNTKAELWKFLRDDVLVTTPVELYGEMELFQLVDQFFDRALYYVSTGYERAAELAA